jgi:hypothetical protein
MSIFKWVSLVRIAGALAAGLACLAIAPAVAGQPQKEKQYRLLPKEGVASSRVIRIDKAYGEKFGADIKAPFEFSVPVSPGIQELANPAPKPGTAILKLNFASMDKKLIENIQFQPLVLPLAPPEDRLKMLARILATEVFPQAVKGAVSSRRLAVRRVIVNGVAGAEVLGFWESATEGRMLMRIVGIPHPKKADGIFTVANIVAKRLVVPTPDDLPRTRTGAVLRYFRFLK